MCFIVKICPQVTGNTCSGILLGIRRGQVYTELGTILKKYTIDTITITHFFLIMDTITITLKKS